MSEKEIMALLEGAYAQTPTLAGFYRKYDDLRKQFENLLAKRGAEPVDFGVTLQKMFPMARIIDDYQREGFEDGQSFRAVRILPRLLTNTREVKRNLLSAIYALLPVNAEGWKLLSGIDEKADKTLCDGLGFDSPQKAATALLGNECEFRLDSAVGEVGVLVRFKKKDPYSPNFVRHRMMPTRSLTMEEFRTKAIDAYKYLKAEKQSAWINFARFGSQLWKWGADTNGFSNLKNAIDAIPGEPFEFEERDTPNGGRALWLKLRDDYDAYSVKATQGSDLMARIIVAFCRSTKDGNGWRSLSEVGAKLNRQEVFNAGYKTLKEAVQDICGDMFEYRVGEAVKHESPFMLRLAKTDGSAEEQPMDKARLRAMILTAFENASTDIDGWKLLTHIGDQIDKESYLSLGYTQLSQAVADLLGGALEMDLGRVRLASTGRNDRFANRYRQNYGYATYTYRRPEGMETRVKELWDYAFFPDADGRPGWNTVINDLADKALEERWYYKEGDKGNNPILQNYVLFTFKRLQHEDIKERERAFRDGRKPNLKIHEEENFAVWNTGLLDKLYEPIYAFFRRRTAKDSHREQPWEFIAFDKYAYKYHNIISRENLPGRAEYFTDPSRLIYDCKAGKPELNEEHILFGNVKRLPLAFIKREAPSSFVFDEHIKEKSREEQDEYYRGMVEAMSDNPNWLRELKTRLSNEVERAVTQVAWNYRTAIPVYDTCRQQLSLLLPLALGDGNTVDTALVVMRQKYKGHYEGKTIFTLDMAYNNARLISRLDPGWLVTGLPTAND